MFAPIGWYDHPADIIYSLPTYWGMATLVAVCAYNFIYQIFISLFTPVKTVLVPFVMAAIPVINGYAICCGGAYPLTAVVTLYSPVSVPCHYYG